MTERITISLRPGLTETLKGVAKLQARSASALCDELLVSGLAARGVQVAVPEPTDPGPSRWKANDLGGGVDGQTLRTKLTITNCTGPSLLVRWRRCHPSHSSPWQKERRSSATCHSDNALRVGSAARQFLRSNQPVMSQHYDTTATTTAPWSHWICIVGTVHPTIYTNSRRISTLGVPGY